MAQPGGAEREGRGGSRTRVPEPPISRLTPPPASAQEPPSNPPPRISDCGERTGGGVGK